VAEEAAFFDLDKTVIAKASVMAFSRPLYREGLLSRRVLARALWSQVVFARFGARAPALDRLRLRLLGLAQGWEQERVRHVVGTTLLQVISPIIYKGALDLIEEHKRAGRRVYIVSAAPREIVEPLAHHVGASEAIATEAAVKDGKYTGDLLRYLDGAQKATAIREVAERHGISLERSWAYTDSATDVPMLEAVGHPVAVNPDRALRRIAQMRGWPVLKFTELAVVTPAGQRPWAPRLVGAGGGVVALGLVVAVVLLRRWTGRERLARPWPDAPLKPARPQAALSLFAAKKAMPAMRARISNFLTIGDTVAGKAANRYLGRSRAA
jgi:HAD superfamily hydrolase (TIGR01490 family)